MREAIAKFRLCIYQLEISVFDSTVSHPTAPVPRVMSRMFGPVGDLNPLRTSILFFSVRLPWIMSHRKPRACIILAAISRVFFQDENTMLMEGVSSYRAACREPNAYHFRLGTV
jgi:hypothetical protein